MKFEIFWSGVKTEKTQLATLPPINEIDPSSHQKLITLMEHRVIDEDYYLNETLPQKLNQMKLNWYENPGLTKSIINVPDTEPDASVWAYYIFVSIYPNKKIRICSMYTVSLVNGNNNKKEKMNTT